MLSIIMSKKEQYQLLATSTPSLPVFLQPWWLNSVCPEWEVALAAQEGSIQGIMVYPVARKWGLTLLRNPLLTPYTGPFFFPPEGLSDYKRWHWEETVFETLWKQLPTYDSMELSCTPSFSNFLLFHHKGCRNSNKITYHLDLRLSEEQLFSGIHTTHRNLIRQSLPLHQVEEGIEYIPHLLTLHRQTFERKGKKYPYPASLPEQIIKTCYRQDQGKLWACRDLEGRVTATLFLVWDQATAYLLLTALDSEKAHAGAIRQLLWKAICFSRERGCLIFDFEGSMDAGIEPFFRRFGGTRKTYLNFVHHKSFLWKMKKQLLG